MGSEPGEQQQGSAGLIEDLRSLLGLARPGGRLAGPNANGRLAPPSVGIACRRRSSGDQSWLTRLVVRSLVRRPSVGGSWGAPCSASLGVGSTCSDIVGAERSNLMLALFSFLSLYGYSILVRVHLPFFGFALSFFYITARSVIALSLELSLLFYRSSTAPLLLRLLSVPARTHEA